MRVQTVQSTRRAREGPGEGEGARGKRVALAPEPPRPTRSQPLFLRKFLSTISLAEVRFLTKKSVEIAAGIG